MERNALSIRFLPFFAYNPRARLRLATLMAVGQELSIDEASYVDHITQHEFNSINTLCSNARFSQTSSENRICGHKCIHISVFNSLESRTCSCNADYYSSGENQRITEHLTIYFSQSHECIKKYIQLFHCIHAQRAFCLFENWTFVLLKHWVVFVLRYQITSGTEVHTLKMLGLVFHSSHILCTCTNKWSPKDKQDKRWCVQQVSCYTLYTVHSP